jgi:hypothetical protein
MLLSSWASVLDPRHRMPPTGAGETRSSRTAGNPLHAPRIRWQASLLERGALDVGDLGSDPVRIPKGAREPGLQPSVANRE